MGYGAIWAKTYMTRRLDLHIELDSKGRLKLHVLRERAVTHRCHLSGGCYLTIGCDTNALGMNISG